MSQPPLLYDIIIEKIELSCYVLTLFYNILILTTLNIDIWVINGDLYNMRTDQSHSATHKISRRMSLVLCPYSMVFRCVDKVSNIRQRLPMTQVQKRGIFS